VLKKKIRQLLKLRPELSFGFYITDFIFRKILLHNRGTRWAIDFTSTIRCPQNIVRGKNCFPGDSPNVYINALNGLILGDGVNIGPHVGIISANHDFFNNDQMTIAKPIVIGAYSWIGKGATILPEVELGPYTIVGAGAIVTKSFKEGYCVVAGNPAKIIKKLDNSFEFKQP
jgi:acetyltransferase-like isoleucine patch superfamily enzyme